MGGQRILILDPTGRAREGSVRIPGPLSRLEGKVVGIFTNRWKSMDLMAKHFERLLRARYRVAEVVTRAIPISEPAPAALLDEMAGTADLAIVGLAN